MNYYPRHIGDIVSATAHLTMIEDGAYNRLLDWYYQDEKPLPGDKRLIYRRIRAMNKQEQAAVDAILAEFFTLDEGVYRQARCDAEIVKNAERADKARRSAEMRWHSDRNANASPEHTEGNALQKPKAKSQSDAAKSRPVGRPEDVPESVWNDFLAHRKAKRAPVTQTVLDDMRREASKISMRLSDAMVMTCRKGWQGFEASWVTASKVVSMPKQEPWANAK